MTKRRKLRTEAQLAVARRGREAQAAAASSHNAAAIVLATAGASAPGAPLATFAAIRRLSSFRSHQVHSNRPLQPLPLLRPPRWRLLEVTPQYVCQPHQPHQPGSHRRSSPPPDFLHRCARHARTHAQLAADCAVGQAAAATSDVPIASHAIPMPEEAILGCSRGRNRTVSMVPHTYAASSGFPGAIQQPPAPYMCPACTSQRACSLLAAQSVQIGRQRPLQLESQVSPSGRASTVRMRKV